MKVAIIFILTLCLFFSGCVTLNPPTEENSDNTSLESDDTNCSGQVCDLPEQDASSEDASNDSDAQTIKGKVIDDNVKVNDACTDSDNGMNSLVSGSVSKDGEEYLDHCIDSHQLLEYMCDGDSVANIMVTCDGYRTCVNGACTSSSNCAGPSTPDTTKQETVTIGQNVQTDICIDYTTVKDYYCANGELKSINHECQPGYKCNGGKCEPMPVICTDSDNGKDIRVRGRTKAVKGLGTFFDQWDECIDEGTVLEHYCNVDGTVTSEEVWCDSGYRCYVDRCIRSDCSETDDGIDIYERGTATDADGNDYTDTCVSDERIREYYCYGNEVESITRSCEGYYCDDDHCEFGHVYID